MLTPFDDFPIHPIQNLCRARMGDCTGIGVLEQFPVGDHEPSGLTGFLDGWSPA